VIIIDYRIKGLIIVWFAEP